MQSKKITGFEEAQLYYPNWEKDFGYFGILKQNKYYKERMDQEMFPLIQLKKVLDGLPLNETFYITQCTFSKRNRQAKNLLRINSCYVDLDTYNADQNIIGQNPDVNIRKDALLQFCDDKLIPKPNLVIFSGRGLYVKWLFETSIPKRAVSRWKKVEEKLIQEFNVWGADANAKDASRVLRTVGSTNKKSGKTVEVLHYNAERYSFDDLANEILPYSREQVADFKIKLKQEKKQRRQKKRESLKLKQQIQKQKDKANGFNLRTLNHARYHDIRKLADIRGGFKEGERMITLMWMLNFMAGSGAIKSTEIKSKARDLTHEFFPDFKYSDSDITTVVEKVAAYNRGETVTFNGKTYSPLYTPKNDTLIEILKITEEEMRQLKTIINKDEKKYRDKVRKEKNRRAKGQLTRAEYEANSANKTKPWEALGIGKTTYYKRKKAGTLPIPISQKNSKEPEKNSTFEPEKHSVIAQKQA